MKLFVLLSLSAGLLAAGPAHDHPARTAKRPATPNLHLARCTGEQQLPRLQEL